MKIILISLILLICGAFQNANAQQSINVPKGNDNPVLIDGIFSKDEWKDAAVVKVSDSVTLYLKQYKGHVFIGVKTDTPYLAYIDMFLSTEGSQIYNLHASMQIGERLLTGNSWTDKEPAWNWGNHVDWISNEIKYDSTKDKNLPNIKDKVFPYEGKEFQLLRSRFAGKQWRLRVEVRGSTSDIVFPNNSDRMNTAGWTILQL